MGQKDALILVERRGLQLFISREVSRKSPRRPTKGTLAETTPGATPRVTSSYRQGPLYQRAAASQGQPWPTFGRRSDWADSIFTRPATVPLSDSLPITSDDIRCRCFFTHLNINLGLHFVQCPDMRLAAVGKGRLQRRHCR